MIGMTLTTALHTCMKVTENFRISNFSSVNAPYKLIYSDTLTLVVGSDDAVVDVSYLCWIALCQEAGWSTDYPSDQAGNFEHCIFQQNITNW